EAFVPKLVAAVAELDFSKQVGPMISEAGAQRGGQWGNETSTRVLIGGRRDGASYEPTVLADAPPTAKVVREEVFGPVLVLSTVDSDDAAFAMVTASPYGLQAGVFTSDVQTAFRAHATLEVGGVIIGDVPSY